MDQIMIIDRGRNNNRIIGNNDIKNTDRTVKTVVRMEGSLQQ